MTIYLKKGMLYVAYAFILIVALYALTYFIPNRPSPFLEHKPLENIIWRIAFWTHVGLGAVALALGPFQLSVKRRQRNLSLHRQLGKLYVVSILLASLGAFYASFFADTGLIASLGFGTLAVVWFYTTLRAYQTIRQKKVNEHRAWMYRSYAVTLAAVTLRIILPVELAILHLPFRVAYPIVAWLCWVPNLLIIEWWLSRRFITRPA
ncbi:DUF2306 domain-containing protein [Spirosoma sp. KCTC 42546]|uniref:DUF2306 domain-containing protein n=1 Tax=Spirosoma sp. KCTC 42546 TaxID=2520506 RepID=UPI00115ABE7C|nr:DUF2306 domain-containing protein [Spirosoma sp. KCTC 42546]QDK79528.1 DUF2306 domain-containing protein [Spirosoma sp. KCTC 42546]